jgi:hypothetical protein
MASPVSFPQMHDVTKASIGTFAAQMVPRWENVNGMLQRDVLNSESKDADFHLGEAIGELGCLASAVVLTAKPKLSKIPTITTKRRTKTVQVACRASAAKASSLL